MRRVIPLLILAVLTVGAVATAALSVSVPAPASRYRIPSCPTGMGVTSSSQPRSIIFTCADDNELLTALRWTHWGSVVASATGTLEWNTCQPFCAAGTWRHVPARIEVGRTVTLAGAPTYSRLTIESAIPHCAVPADWSLGPNGPLALDAGRGCPA